MAAGAHTEAPKLHLLLILMTVRDTATGILSPALNLRAYDRCSNNNVSAFVL